MNLIIIIVFICLFALYFLINYLMIEMRTLKSLAKLQAGTAVIGTGNLDFKMDEKENDEIGTLSRAFNLMAANLKNITASKTDLEKEIDQRKRFEKELQESEEKFLKNFISSPIAQTIAHLPDGRWVDVNDSFLRLLEYTREEVIGHTSAELKIFDDKQRASVLEEIQERGTVLSKELIVRTKTGKLITVLSSNTMIVINGEAHSISTIVDITERKQAEEEIHRLNRELRAIGECNQAIVHAKNEQNLLNDICRILKETAGYRMAWIGTVQQDENKSVRPIVCSGDEEYLANANITWADTERGRGPTGLAVRTGKTHYFQDFITEPAAAPWREAAMSMGYRSSIAIPLFDNAGTVFGVFTAYSPVPNYFDPAEIRLLEALAGDISFGVNALRDRTKRERAEAEISHLASFPELNPNPVLEINSEGNVLYANQAAKTDFPLMVQGQKGQYLMELIDLIQKEKVQLVTRDIGVGDAWYEQTLAYVPSTKTYFLYGRNITARKIAEDELRLRTAELEASNKELEAFSYSVSHDLRAPLRSITGFSNVLLEDYNDELDKEGKSYLKKISDSGELMGQLMDDLLKLSRVTRSDLNYQRVSLTDIAQKVVDDLRSAEPKRKVQVTIAPDLVAFGDRNLLYMVLENLIGNAWKYSSKTSEPRIEMGTLEHNGKRAYFVRDNGVGFDMTYADKLFKPFQRLHRASEFSGTGIGLATVQRIIRRHGGEVWAESKVGEGATFYFTLN